ncbi:MAG: AMP-binding protein [Actinobacteria bacterium]|nr:AMP-binding protein [Actinomycetota bacterium]
MSSVREAPAPGVDTGLDTLPGRVRHHARVRGDAVAMREKQLGVWRGISWAEYWSNVRATGLALADLGVGPRDHVAILSDNRPEWLYADLGTEGIGARSVGVYATNPAPQVAYVLRHSGSVAVFCEGQEQVDKVVAVAGETPSVRHVIVFDPRGTRGYDDPRLVDWESFLSRGRELDAADPEAFERLLARVDPAEPCMVVYTSGTTGPPKGAMLTSRNVTAASEATVRHFGYTEKDQLLSYLPLCHVAEKIFTLFLPLTSGATVHFGESIETVAQDLREVSPTVFLGVPRIWEKLQATIEVKMQDASPLKRWLYRRFTRSGQALVRKRMRGERWSAADRLRWRLGDLMVYRPLQERLGLRRCWFPISGAAPIAPEVIWWFHGIGVPIHEGYGQTEGTGVSHVNPPGQARIGTVGTVVPMVEHRIAEDGEILVRGPNVFAGYLHDPEATGGTVDDEGWLHTGDVGELDEDGYLTITGRKKDIIITAGGKNLSPEQIENALKTSPYVKEAVVIGDRRKFISALVQIEADTVGNWASRRGITYTSFADLSSRPEVRTLIEEEIKKANEQLSRVEQVKAFRLLPKELHQDDEELTATQKVRRRVFEERYADLIGSIYGAAG